MKHNYNSYLFIYLFLKEFSPATGVAPGSSRLAGWALPLTIWYFIEGRPQTKQVEGFITLITQDQFVILTCKEINLYKTIRNMQQSTSCKKEPLTLN